MLAAGGIPHRVAHDGAGWTLLAPAPDAARAQAALVAYDEESAGDHRPASAGASSPGVAWAVGVTVGVGLLAFFALTGPPAVGSRWFARGAAATAPIAGGELWRTVTALTLHVDAVHAAGNAVASAVLLPPVIQRLGPGCGLWLVLLAGAGATLLGALARDPGHVSVGASTATFGAIGILAALRLFAAPGATKVRRGRWTVLVASLLLLVMLGVGPDADVLGHSLGLTAGGVLGLVAGATVRRPPGPVVQWALVTLAALAVVVCWRLALTASSP